MIVFLVLLLFEIKYNYILSRMGALWSMDKKLVMLRAQIRLLCCVFVQDAFPLTVPPTHEYIYVIYWAGSPYVKKLFPRSWPEVKVPRALIKTKGMVFSPYGLTLRLVNNLFLTGFLLFSLIWC